LAVVGLPPEALSFQALGIVGNEIRIVGAAVGTREDMRAVLDLAVAGELRCQVEMQPLADVNEVFARMQRSGISGRVVLRCC
jgi:propanol-preferring alcohol dehydrogenase